LLQQDGDVLHYHLKPIEKFGALNGSPRMPLSAIREVKLVENPWTTAVLRGLRAPGTGFPYLIMLGTMRHRRGKDFCVVYKRRPVLVLEFDSGPWSRWVIPASESNQAVLEGVLASK
jgi:hypothetical protein